ncbi:MAG: PilZ domain-containing protein [Thiohalocapsa sp. PB-PSB1]|nr:MAG: hypothetical protein N838_07320 [Thiohalocapsa sp. PB-PSB1]QQO53898.1 MAG: PilZ domain-containing protein [Thiohalocapsa sp. PB-PSB1]
MNAELQRDKRLNVRVCYQDPVLIHSISPPPVARYRYALADDISEGGMRMTSTEMFPVDSRLLLEIETDQAQPPIRVIGCVMWVAQAGYQDRWLSGVKFIEASDADHVRLQALVSIRSAIRSQ